MEASMFHGSELFLEKVVSSLKIHIVVGQCFSIGRAGSPLLTVIEVQPSLEDEVVGCPDELVA